MHIFDVVGIARMIFLLGVSEESVKLHKILSFFVSVMKTFDVLRANKSFVS